MLCKTKTHSVNGWNPFKKKSDSTEDASIEEMRNWQSEYEAEQEGKERARKNRRDILTYLAPEKGKKFGDTFLGSGLDYYFTRTGQMTPGVMYQPSKSSINYTYVLLGLAVAGTGIYLATRPKNKKRR